MKITIERKSFVEALTIGSQMAAKAKGLSVLENVKLSIKDNFAIISSFDSEIAITKRTNIVKHDDNFILCIEPKSLLSILRSIKDNEIEMVFENYTCEIIHSKGRLSLPYTDADDFPTPNIEKNLTAFTLESKVLFNWLKEAKNFVIDNTLYPQLMGVYLYSKDNEFGVAATDMNVMYHNKIENTFIGNNIDALISVKTIDALLPMINGTDKVTIKSGERNVVFIVDDAMLSSVKAEKPFPNFKSIIPKNNEIKVDVNKEEMLESVKRAMLTANEKTCLLKIEFSGISIKIESEDIMNAKKSHEECLANCCGGNITIGLKGTYVLQMLNSIESDNIQILLSEPKRPVLWCDMLNNNKILLQMPFSF